MPRIVLAVRSLLSILFTGRLSEELAGALGLAPKPAAPAAAVVERPESAADGALQMLGILQRDARLIDFLMEDISGYPDDQVGAAVRTLHEQCRQSLERYVRLAPVIDGVEGTYTRLDAVADPGHVKLIGNVPIGGKPEGGVLRHRGWRAARIELPKLAAGEDATVIAPAEIEID